MSNASSFTHELSFFSFFIIFYQQGHRHHGGSGGGCPLAFVIRGRTGAEECPLSQDKSYYIKRVRLEDSLSIRNDIVVILYIGQHWSAQSQLSLRQFDDGIMRHAGITSKCRRKRGQRVCRNQRSAKEILWTV